MPKSERQGYLVDIEGNKLGYHDGLWAYTIGQRARIPNKERALFVAKKQVGDSEQDILVVPA